MERIRAIFLCSRCRTMQAADPERDDAGIMVRNHQVNERTSLLSLGSTSTSSGIFQLTRRCSRYCDIFWIVFLFLVFFVGVTVGAYLLSTEDEEWMLPGRLNIISRYDWHAHAPSAVTTMPALLLPVMQVVLVLVQTNSTGCHSEAACAKLVLELQSMDMLERKQPDIMYNFIVTGNGDVYEGRGWNFQSSYLDGTSASAITLAFLGDFRETFPTRRQVQSAALFHEYALMEGYLASCYRILVWGESRRLIDIAYNIQQQVKPQCEGLF